MNQSQVQEKVCEKYQAGDSRLNAGKQVTGAKRRKTGNRHQAREINNLVSSAGRHATGAQ